MSSFIQIPNLPLATALNGTEQLEGVQAGVSVRVTTAQIATYAAATVAPPSPVPTEALYESLQLAAWGDSLTYGFGGEEPLGPYIPYMTQMANWAPFRPYVNEGVSGETSTQIADRFMAAPQYWRWTTILWMGRNDIAAFGSNWAQVTLANLQRCVAALASVGNTRYIIWGVTTNGLEYTGGPAEENYNEIIAANQLFAATFGDKFFDMRAWMASLAPFDALSLTPDATSLMEIARNEIPTFWRRDSTNVHYNDNGTNSQGYQAVQNVDAMDLVTPDGTMTVFGTSALIGNGTMAAFNDLRIYGRLFMGDPIQGAGPVITENSKQKIFMVGGGQAIPDNISAATTREWAIFGQNSGGTTATGRALTITGVDNAVAITTGSFHVLNGTRAGNAIITANSCTLSGVDSGAKLDSDEHTGYGRATLANSYSVSPSTAGGMQTGFALLTGTMTGWGWKALRNSEYGNGNSAFGEQAAYNTNADWNVNGTLTLKISGSTYNTGDSVTLTSVGVAFSGGTIGKRYYLRVGDDRASVLVTGNTSGSICTGTLDRSLDDGTPVDSVPVTLQNIATADWLVSDNVANNNTDIGKLAGFSNTKANGRVTVGARAGFLSTADFVTFIGFQNSDLVTSASQCIGIGANLDLPSATQDGQITVGNIYFATGAVGTGTTIAGKAGIAISSPTARLSVKGVGNTSSTFTFDTVNSDGTAGFWVRDDGAIRIGPAITPPASASAGVGGQFAYDASFLYVCTSANVWKRAAVSTW